jgi:1-deoxy-D-xylulose-5-phosphate reductoisomerase
LSVAPSSVSPSPSSSVPFQRLALLGSTGSIGVQTLQVATQYPDRFEVVGLAGGQQVAVLAEQLKATPNVRMASVATAQGLAALKEQVSPSLQCELLHGEAGLMALATHPDVDTVVVGLVGVLGLAPTLAALKAGKRVVTANKETFVAGGHLVAPYLDQIVPFDSEHSALFQCLQGQDRHGVRALWLTASGGPFRTTEVAELAHVTPAQALAHPTWRMGPKVSIDSATMMNKGLEMIEAHWLFGVPMDQVEVVIHPQSIIHSLVEYVDGSLLAHLGSPDMRVPIQYALSYPHRLDGAYMGTRLSLAGLSGLTFEPPDPQRFPALGLARQAMAQYGQAGSIVLNAADEVAVAAFLEGRIGFADIAAWVERALAACPSGGSSSIDTLAGVLALDQWCRAWVRERL